MMNCNRNPLSTEATRKALCDFYIAACTEDGGAYRFRLYEDGKAEQIQKIPMPSPMFLQMENDLLWATLRAPFAENTESGIAAYDTKSGERVTEILSTKGVVSCHIAVDNGDVYCPNYVSGSVFLSPDRLSVHTGQGVDPKRQLSPHTHCTLFSPDKRFLLCCDLGIDSIFVYDRELNEISRARVPDGAGARHAIFSKDGKYVYCINEMGGSISVFSWDAPHLTLLNTVSILPDGHDGIGAGAAIKLSQNGAYLYATERASATIVTLKVDGEKLTVLSHTDCKGVEPRDFTLLGGDRFAVCTNQFGNSVAFFKINEKAIPEYLYSIELGAPLCAIEIE